MSETDKPIRLLTQEERHVWAGFMEAAMGTSVTGHVDGPAREADRALLVFRERCAPSSPPAAERSPTLAEARASALGVLESAERARTESAHDSDLTVHADPAVFAVPGLVTLRDGVLPVSGKLDEVTCSGCLRLIARQALAEKAERADPTFVADKLRHRAETAEAEVRRLNALIAPEREAAAAKGREVVRLGVEIRALAKARQEDAARNMEMASQVGELHARAEKAEAEIASKDRALPGLLAEGKRLEQERAEHAESRLQSCGAILQEAVNVLARLIPYRARSLEICALIGRAAGAGFPAREAF